MTYDDLSPMPPKMFAGLVGEMCDTYAEHTEAAPVAIGAQFLVAFGNAVGAAPHFYVGETRHHTNENLLVVGRTGRSRKGDSKEIALKPLKDADPDWARNIRSGLSSGEGLIHHVRDPIEKVGDSGEARIVDPGITDKRLLDIETEFSGPLKVMTRDGNTVSNVVRDAWDHISPLGTLTKNSPLRATGAHISILAHTTPEDLSVYLANTEAANGFANRFIIIETARVRLLPSPGRAQPHKVERLVNLVRAALEFGRRVGEMRRTVRAERVWHDVYPMLTEDEPGLVGKLLARSEAHVARLSALYALISLSKDIDRPHLESALTFWDYATRSTRRIFEHRTGNDAADRIKQELLPGQSLPLTSIREQIFSNHITAARLQEAVKLLKVMNEVTVERENTEGRPRIVVTRVRPEERESLRKNSAQSVERGEHEGAQLS